MKTLIKREDKITCGVCKSKGERLSFDDGTTQVQHPKKYDERVQQYVTPACKEVNKTR